MDYQVRATYTFRAKKFHSIKNICRVTYAFSFTCSSKRTLLNNPVACYISPRNRRRRHANNYSLRCGLSMLSSSIISKEKDQIYILWIYLFFERQRHKGGIHKLLMCTDHILSSFSCEHLTNIWGIWIQIFPVILKKILRLNLYILEQIIKY